MPTKKPDRIKKFKLDITICDIKLLLLKNKK